MSSIVLSAGNSTPLFGAHLATAEKTSTSSTSSMTFVNYLTLTTSDVPAGKYRLSTLVQNLGGNTEWRLQQDASTTIYLQYDPPYDTSRTVPKFVERLLDLTAGIHTFDLEFRATIATTVFMQQARFVFFRVS